ncbi:MAG: HPr family phosphocarrier protein [bacterium]
MVAKKVVVKNATGLHLKPAAFFCKEALKYKSLVTFTCGDTTANAKSVLSVLGACVKAGDEIEVVCDGPDEEMALSAIVEAVESGLGEELNGKE